LTKLYFCFIIKLKRNLKSEKLMSVKDQLRSLKSGEMANVFRKSSVVKRNNEHYIIVYRRAKKFSYRIKVNGRWESHNGFPKDEDLKLAKYLNIFRQTSLTDNWQIETKAKEVEERDRDFLRPFR
jgi:hypothetical protein